ncbi:MAG: hypothetical protein FWC43_12265, partial [Planctomycetaceae bacterium]|nr:hypothetical protein [Planctomycetaceae bacterium]
NEVSALAQVGCLRTHWQAGSLRSQEKSDFAILLQDQLFYRNLCKIGLVCDFVGYILGKAKTTFSISDFQLPIYPMPLDLTSEPNSTSRAPTAGTETQAKDSASAEQKKYVGVRFHCCGLYVRIYVNKEGTAYEGRCPKCARPVRLRIGEGGTSNRFFDAY